MNRLIEKVTSVWSSIAKTFSASKKEAENQLNDAISLHINPPSDTVEDFEIAAYHNQA